MSASESEWTGTAPSADAASPVAVQVNEARGLVAGMRGMLEFRLRNRDPLEAFTFDLRLASDLCAAPGVARTRLRLAGGRTELWRVDVEPARCQDAGPYRLSLEFEIVEDANPATRHRVTGEHVAMVLSREAAAGPSSIHLNYIQSGMGGIQDVHSAPPDPASWKGVGVNTMLGYGQAARFVEIPLTYRGTVAARDRLFPPDALPSAQRLAIVDPSGIRRTLIISTDSVLLGRQPDLCDIVTMNTKPHPAGGYVCDRISRRHMRLVRRAGAVVVEPVSSTNPTWLDEVRIDGPTPLVPGGRYRLRLTDGFDLMLSVLRPAELSAEVQERLRMEHDGAEARIGLGGVLIERTDEHAGAERYLWLHGVVGGEHLGLPGGREVRLIALPGLAVLYASASGPRGQALRVGDEVFGVGRLGEWQQDLPVTARHDARH